MTGDFPWDTVGPWGRGMVVPIKFKSAPLQCRGVRYSITAIFKTLNKTFRRLKTIGNIELGLYIRRTIGNLLEVKLKKKNVLEPGL